MWKKNCLLLVSNAHQTEAPLTQTKMQFFKTFGTYCTASMFTSKSSSRFFSRRIVRLFSCKLLTWLHAQCEKTRKRCVNTNHITVPCQARSASREIKSVKVYGHTFVNINILSNCRRFMTCICRVFQYIIKIIS